MAFAINLLVTVTLGNNNQWAWRIPVIVMQIYPVLLLASISRLPETPRYLISKGDEDAANEALVVIYGKEDAGKKFDDLKQASEDELSKAVNYADMLRPSGAQWHPTVVTIMGQVNQALTGYGAVSVYGPQIFELLFVLPFLFIIGTSSSLHRGFEVRTSEYLTLGNYLSYFILMTFAWLLIDVLGRRKLMIGGAFAMALCFLILTLLGGLAIHARDINISQLPVSISGAVVLYISTGAFGIGWLPEPWLIPTEIYPSTARAQGAAISVVVWGFANFAVTLLTPIGFNNLKYWLFLVFACTNCIAGW